MGALAELPLWLSASLGAVTTSVRGRTTARRQRQAGISRHARSWPAAGKKPAVPLAQQAHKGRVAVNEAIDAGARMALSFAAIMAKNSGSRSPWTAVTEALDWAASTGGYDSDTVQDVMLRAVERRFGDALPASPVEWLTDNGSVYRAHETRAFAREIGLEPRTTAVRSPQSNGIAESFVKTMKRDYIEMMPKPDSRTAVGNLAIAFEHYNEHHPHSALGYRSLGNICAVGYHNPKRERVSGSMGSNPSGEGFCYQPAKRLSGPGRPGR